MKSENNSTENEPTSKENVINFSKSEKNIRGFSLYSSTMTFAIKNNKYGNLINPFELNSDDFLKRWKTLEESEESKDKKELFDNLWDYILKINKNNITDFYLINNISKLLLDDVLIQRFLFLLFNLIDDSLDNYIKDENKFILVKNNLIYCILILFNLKNNERFNYFFIKKIDYLTLLITKIQKIKNLKAKDYFNNILNKLFSTEYIHLGLSSFLPKNNNEEQKEDNNIIINGKDENVNNSNNEIYKILKDFYQKEIKADINYETQKEKYIKVVESLFDFDSVNFLNYKQNKELEYNEHFFEQIELTKNIILIVFSKEKYQYLKNDNVYYEYEFLDKLIKKNILETKKIHEDKYKSLFRRDTVSNNIIKYIFFLFGNNMIIESIFKPLNKIVNIIGLDNEYELISLEEKTLNIKRNITKFEFGILFEKMLNKLKETIPFFLRVFLKIVYDNVVNEYPNIKKGDYTPLSSLLFFCYLSNPRNQRIYEIYPNKNLLIKSIYRLIYNTSFNIKFNEEDDLNIFNDEIEKYYNKINEFYENNIINIEINEENKKYLKNLFDEIGVEFPIFIFYLCCDYICNLNKGINIVN